MKRREFVETERWEVSSVCDAKEAKAKEIRRKRFVEFDDLRTTLSIKRRELGVQSGRWMSIIVYLGYSRIETVRERGGWEVGYR